ncbi:MAG: tryptophan 7-halogenase [Pseudomonadota bacterium]
MKPSQFDVVIGGDGPAGLSAALALREHGMRVALVSSPVPQAPPRAEMLPPAAEPILTRLGLEDSLDHAVALRPTLSIWSRQHAEYLGHGMSITRPAIALDKHALVAMLRARVASKNAFFQPYRVRGISGAPGAWCVTTGGGPTLRARFVIDATGRAAYLARRLGARLHLGASLVAKTFYMPSMFRPQLVVEATNHGWWYALPLKTGGTMGFVSAGGIAPDISVLLPDPDDRKEGQQMWDARNARLSPCAGPGWLATGDAAAAFDPVASQGLFNALSGGFFAGHAAADAIMGERDALDVYAELTVRTAKRTHSHMPYHYQTAKRHTPFWHCRRRSDVDFTLC